MSILISNLNTIESCKLDIKSAIEAKGVDMTSASLPDYAAAITNIPAGGWTEEDITTRNLSIADLSNNATFVSEYVFATDSWIETVNLPNCTEVCVGAFCSCPELRTVNLPTCLTVKTSAFYTCYNLTTVSLPVCSNIHTNAFDGCTALESISLPECVSIQGSAFLQCESLNNVYLPKCSYIGAGAFLQCGLYSIDLPVCTQIGYEAFYGCGSLTRVSIPNIYSLGMSTFQDCTILSELTIGTSTYRIPSYNDALVGTPFYYGDPNCSIYIDQTMYSRYVEDVEWGSYSSYFVSIGTAEQMLSMENGTVFGKTYYLSSDFSTVLGLTKTDVTSISFSNISSIGTNLFYGYTNLINVSLPNCVTLGPQAFMNCSKLPSIYLPKCEAISGRSVFAGCTSLKNIYLPGSVVCTLAYSNAIPSITLSWIYVPSSLVSTYQAAKNWSYFAVKIRSII